MKNTIEYRGYLSLDDYLAGAQANGWVIVDPKAMATL